MKLNLNLFTQREEPFPPQLSDIAKILILTSYFVIACSLIYLTEQFCPIHPISFLSNRFSLLEEFSRSCVWGTYIALGILLLIPIILCMLRHKLFIHKSRLVDLSVVESMFIEVATVESRIENPKKPDDFDKKKKQIEDEVTRLTKLGNRGWTEFQILSLNQLLVDFLKIDELKARTRSTLANLKEYSFNRTSLYDRELYEQWESRINEVFKSIDNIDRSSENYSLQVDITAEALRAQLRTLLEEVSNYEQLWAEGSAIVRDIRICGIMALFPIIIIGLLPIIHPIGDNVIGILNWGFLGIGGAVTAVLLGMRKSDYVEIGNTEGKIELWRAILSTGLGFVASILLYSMIAGGILDGHAFPDIPPNNDSGNIINIDTARSIFWGIASGFSFEMIFEKIRNTTDENY